MTKAVVFAFAFVSLGCASKHSRPLSKAQKDSILYVQRVSEFLGQVRTVFFRDSNVSVADSVIPYNYFECLNHNLSNEIEKRERGVFNEAEVKYITELPRREVDSLRFMAYPKLSIWTHAQFPANPIIKKDSLDSILKDPIRSITYFTKFKGEYYLFATPVFLADGAYCLFYLEHHYGGGARMMLYKKTKGKWEPQNSYCGYKV